MADFGDGYYYHVTGLVHTYDGLPSQNNALTTELIDRLHTKITRAQDEITIYHQYLTDDADVLVIAYGGTARAAVAAVKEARNQGVKAGLLTLVTIWPFPAKIVEQAAARVKKVIVPEMNYGQLVGEIERYVPREKVISLTRYDGELFRPDEIVAPILAAGGSK